MANPFETKLTEEGKEFIVWAKRNGKPVSYIKDILKQILNENISDGRISQIWKRYAEDTKFGKTNPYQNQIKELGADDEPTEFLAGFSKDLLDETSESKSPNLSPADIHDPDDEAPALQSKPTRQFTAPPINWDVILESAGWKPARRKSFHQIMDTTDNSPNSAMRVLDALQVTYAQQKQILTSAYGLDFAEKLMGGRDNNNSQSNEPQSFASQAMQQATSMLHQRLRNMQDQMAYEETKTMLERIQNNTSGKTEEDPLKIAKDIAALKAINSEDKSLTTPLIEALVQNALKKNDTSIIDGIKLAMEMQRPVQNRDGNDLIQMYQRELTETHKMQQQQQNEMMNKLMEIQNKNFDLTRQKDEKINEQLRNLEKQNLELITQQLREKVENSIRSESEWMDYFRRQIETAKTFGFIKDGGVTDPEAQASIDRLKVIENIANTAPDKFDNFADRLLGRIESMGARLLEYQEKKEQMQMNQYNMQFQPKFNQPQARPAPSRNSILNAIEGQIDDIEEKRKMRDEMRELNIQS